MGAQTIKEVKLDEARAIIATGKKIAEHTYGIPARNITVTVREGSRRGYVKLIITKGCVC